MIGQGHSLEAPLSRCVGGDIDTVLHACKEIAVSLLDYAVNRLHSVPKRVMPVRVLPVTAKPRARDP